MGSMKPAHSHVEVDFTFVDEDGDEHEAVAECVIEDCGIGSYEYWGAKGVDVNYAPFFDAAHWVDESGVAHAIAEDEVDESTLERILEQAEEKAADDDVDFDPGDD